jgi:hypothetical protein
MDENLSQLWVNDELSLTLLMTNLFVGFLLSLVLKFHFEKFGSTLSNRQEFALVFPFILLTTVLIISIIKSSLALSLGLVGALSIVRFRTPIKEPEELAYLFFAIAIGLGLGANQTLITTLSSFVILGGMALIKRRKNDFSNKQLYLSLDWQLTKSGEDHSYFDAINQVILKHCDAVNLRRYDLREGFLEATYLLNVSEQSSINDLFTVLRSEFPSMGATVLDQNQMPSV